MNINRIDIQIKFTALKVLKISSIFFQINSSKTDLILQGIPNQQCKSLHLQAGESQ